MNKELHNNTGSNSGRERERKHSRHNIADQSMQQGNEIDVTLNQIYCCPSIYFCTCGGIYSTSHRSTHIDDRLDGADVRLPTDHRDFVLLDLDHALHDQGFEERRVLAALGYLLLPTVGSKYEDKQMFGTASGIYASRIHAQKRWLDACIQILLYATCRLF